MNLRNDNRQATLFVETDSEDDFGGFPPDIRALRDKQQQQSRRLTEIQCQFGPYFLHALAGLAEERLVARVIEFLKKTVPGVLGAQGAENLWDEICVGLREGSPFSEMYVDHISKVTQQESKRLPQAERVALWLTSYWGEMFMGSIPDEINVPNCIPVDDGEIAKHIVQSVCNEAFNYENSWISEMTGN